MNSAETPQKSYLMMKRGQNRGVIWQVSRKFSWKQTSWGDKRRKNAYKRVGWCNRKGVQEDWRKESLRKNKRETCSSWIDLRAFSFQSNPLYHRKKIYIFMNRFLFPHYLLISCLDLPLWKFYPIVCKINCANHLLSHCKSVHYLFLTTTIMKANSGKF